MGKRISRSLIDMALMLAGLALVAVIVFGALDYAATDTPATPDGDTAQAAPSAPTPPATTPDADAPAPVPGTPGFEADVALAAKMLTTADRGGNLGRTLRWDGPTVTYSITPGADWTAEFIAETRRALEWNAEASGLDFVEVGADANPQVTISGRERRGGTVWVFPNGSGSIGRARVEMGCCSRRVPNEELGQALGVLADLGDDRSVFSANRTRFTTSDWDRWLIRALYRIPTGSSPEVAADALRAEAHDLAGR